LPITVHATIFFFESHSLLILLARVQCRCVRRQGRIKGTNPAMVPCSMNIAVFKAPQHPQFRGRRASKGRKRVDKMQVIESCNCLTQVIFCNSNTKFCDTVKSKPCLDTYELVEKFASMKARRILLH